MKKSQKKRGTRDSFRSLDQFSQNVNFSFDGGKVDFKTLLGATFTVFMMVGVFAYGLQKTTVMLKFLKYDVNTNIQNAYYPKNYTF